jgi:hypothetical protein
MDLPQFVRDTFKSHIFAQPFSNEQKRALMQHERVSLFQGNLIRGLVKAPKIPVPMLKQAIEDLTDLFISLVKREAQERIMSRAKLAELRKIEDDKADFRKAAEVLDEKGVDHVFEVKGGEIIKSGTVIDPV